MLTLDTGTASKDCTGHSRRDFLRVGALGMSALTLPQFLAAKSASAGSTQTSFIKDKAVVLLYLSGGASHIETFNPNMDVPAPFCSMTGEVKTSLKGVTFGGTFPKLARHAHEMAMIRSFAHPVGGHEQAHVHVLSGGLDSGKPDREFFSIGSMYARLRGTSNPKTGMPTYGLLTEKEVDGQYRKELGRVVKGSAPGSLGGAYGPLNYEGEDEEGAKGGRKRRSRKSRNKSSRSLMDDMKLTIKADRLGNRKALLGELDTLRRGFDRHQQFGTLDKYQEQAYDLVLGSAGKAFDLSGEDPKLVQAYDTSRMMIGHKVFRKSTLGKQMLMARRLVEAGCGFITVHSAGWDMHADGNNPGMIKGMNMLGSTLDQAVSAFLADVRQRGLSDKILLVITGDFGRTPTINKRGGRDHWARLGTLAFAGGGLKMGQVVGRADRRNGEPDSDAVTPRHMMDTILHTVFDMGALRLVSGLPRDLMGLVESANPIHALV